MIADGECRRNQWYGCRSASAIGLFRWGRLHFRPWRIWDGLLSSTPSAVRTRQVPILAETNCLNRGPV